MPTYALCGFANFSSIAIQIGGIGGMAPERKSELASLGLRAMIAGTLACLQTATIAGLLGLSRFRDPPPAGAERRVQGPLAHPGSPGGPIT